MLRPHLNEVLGHVVHARISMDGLQQDIILEMRTGHSPTYRGIEWGREHFEVLSAAAMSIDLAFGFLKVSQYPEVAHSRLPELHDMAERLVTFTAINRIPPPERLSG